MHKKFLVDMFCNKQGGAQANAKNSNTRTDQNRVGHDFGPLCECK